MNSMYRYQVLRFGLLGGMIAVASACDALPQSTAVNDVGSTAQATSTVESVLNVGISRLPPDLQQQLWVRVIPLAEDGTRGAKIDIALPPGATSGTVTVPVAGLMEVRMLVLAPDQSRLITPAELVEGSNTPANVFFMFDYEAVEPSMEYLQTLANAIYGPYYDDFSMRMNISSSGSALGYTIGYSGYEPITEESMAAFYWAEIDAIMQGLKARQLVSVESWADEANARGYRDVNGNPLTRNTLKAALASTLGHVRPEDGEGALMMIYALGQARVAASGDAGEDPVLGDGLLDPLQLKLLDLSLMAVASRSATPDGNSPPATGRDRTIAEAERASGKMADFVRLLLANPQAEAPYELHRKAICTQIDLGRIEVKEDPQARVDGYRAMAWQPEYPTQPAIVRLNIQAPQPESVTNLASELGCALPSATLQVTDVALIDHQEEGVIEVVDDSGAVELRFVPEVFMPPSTIIEFESIPVRPLRTVTRNARMTLSRSIAGRPGLETREQYETSFTYKYQDFEGFYGQWEGTEIFHDGFGRTHYDIARAPAVFFQHYEGSQRRRGIFVANAIMKTVFTSFSPRHAPEGMPKNSFMRIPESFTSRGGVGGTISFTKDSSYPYTGYWSMRMGAWHALPEGQQPILRWEDDSGIVEQPDGAHNTTYFDSLPHGILDDTIVIDRDIESILSQYITSRTKLHLVWFSPVGNLPEL